MILGLIDSFGFGKAGGGIIEIEQRGTGHHGCASNGSGLFPSEARKETQRQTGKFFRKMARHMMGETTIGPPSLATQKRDSTSACPVSRRRPHQNFTEQPLTSTTSCGLTPANH
jgi:hypothetical protein